MKKRTFILILTLVLALCMLVACDPDKNSDPKPSDQNVTVTFNLSDEGENVVRQGKTGEDMQAPALADTERYYFGGWYANPSFEGEAADVSKFPQSSMTYWALWYVKYTFKATFEQPDGTFVADASHDKTGRVPKLSTNSVTLSAAEFDAVEGYTLEHNSYTVNIESEGKDFEAEIKYMIGSLAVTYKTGIGDDLVQTGKYGLHLYDVDQLGEFSCRHFVGWSTEEGGDAEYFGGEVLNKTGEFTLYAVWEMGLTDLLGGSDILYVSKTEEGKVYLERYELEDQQDDRETMFEGTYEGKLFSVKISDSFTLSGVLLDNGFYYFKDAVEKTYANVSDSAERLELVTDGVGKAILHKQGAADVEGTYTFDPQTGFYAFEEVGGDVKFVFKLLTDGGDLAFQKSDELVAHNYVYRFTSAGTSTYYILKFDGFGTVTRSFDPRYEIEDDFGTYAWNESQSLYEVAFEDEDLALRLSDEDAGKVVGGRLLDGSVVMRDQLSGNYYANIEDKQQKDDAGGIQLTLDGFGKGTYLGEEIEYTYEIEYAWYEESSYDEDFYGIGRIYWVSFSSGGKDITVCVEDSQANSRDYFVLVEGEFAMEVFSSDSDLGDFYGGNGYESYDGTLGVFVYKYGKSDGAMVTVYSAYVGALTGMTVLTEVDWGTIQKSDEFADTFVYTSTYEYHGKTQDVTFMFRYNDDGDISPQLYKQKLEITQNLTIDEFGYATYAGANGPEEVEYSYDPGWKVSFLTFQIPDDDGNTTAQVYRVEFDEDDNRTFEYLPNFHMITDVVNECAIATIPNGNGSFKAYIGLEIELHIWYYILEGTATVSDGIYTFDIDPDSVEDTLAFLNAQGEEITELMKPYFNFKYRITDEKNGECEFVTDAYSVTATDGSVLAFGDNGSVSLTVGGKTMTTTTFNYLTEDVLVLRVVQDGVSYDKYITVTFDEDAKTIKDFKVGGDEANRYYLESELATGLEIFTRYFILLGYGQGIMVNSSSGMSIYAEYAATGKTFTWGGVNYVEYSIGVCYDSQDDIPDIFYTIAVTTDDFNIEGGTKWHAGKYLARSYGWGEFEIEGGGSVSGDGYHLAEFTDANGVKSQKELYFVEVEDRDFANSAYPEIVDELGESICIVDRDEDGRIIERVVYDVVEDGKVAMRDDFNGVYAEVLDNVPGNGYIYMNGRGQLIVYDENDEEVERGTYATVPALGEKFLRYTPSDPDSEIGTFTFWIFRMDGITVYIKYNAANKGVFYGADGDLLVTDGFGQGLYMDKYGVVSSGLCTYLTSTVVEFSAYGTQNYIYLSLDSEHSKVQPFTGEYIVKGTTLQRYIGHSTSLRIDDNITEIGAKAFMNSALRSIDLNNVTKVGQQAFEYCEDLAEVIAPNVVEIGIYAFADCFPLSKIELPLVEIIGDGAFRSCELSSVKLGNIKSIGQYAFSHESSTMTEFDLTECEDLGALTASNMAFLATVDQALGSYPINMKVYVKDIAALNQLLANENVGTVLTNTAGLQKSKNDRMGGVSYIDFEHKAIYLFDGGTIILRDDNGSRIYGVYVDHDANSSSGVDVYVRNGNEYQKKFEGITSSKTQTFDGALMFKAGLTLKFTADSHNIELKFTVEPNDYFNDITFTAKFDDSTDTTTNITSAGDLRFAVGSTNAYYYDIRITGADSCELILLGIATDLYTQDRFYKLSCFINEGKITDVLSFAYHSNTSASGGYIYVDKGITDVVVGDSGDITFRWWYYSDECVTFNVKYIAGETPSIEAKLAQWTMVQAPYTSAESNSSADMTFTFDIDTLEVTSIDYFAYVNSRFDATKPLTIRSWSKQSSKTGTSEYNQPQCVTVILIETDEGVFEVTITTRRNPEGMGTMPTYSATYSVVKLT